MTMVKRCGALLVALVLFLTAAAFCEEESDPVLAVVGGTEITGSMADEYVIYAYYNGYIDDFTDYQTAVTYLVQNIVIENKLRENGYCDFSDEEMEALRADAEQNRADAYDSYVSYYLSEDTEEARAQLRLQAEDYYRDTDFLENQIMNAALERWYASIEGEPVTEEDILELYESYVKEDEEMFRDDIFTYEYYQYYGYYSLYIPEGYRNVLRILLTVDDDLLSAYQDALVALEEADGTASEETKEQLRLHMAESKEMVLDCVRDKLEIIENALAAGTDFIELIREYGEDMYLTDEYGNLETGYTVHPDSILQDADFIAGAFDESMQKPGDHSVPVVTGEGVNIFYYLSDEPAGPVAMTDDVKEALRSDMETEQLNRAYQAVLDAWVAESDVTYYPEQIEAASERILSLYGD